MADYKFETKVIHAGVEPDPQTGAVMTPIYQTSTYAQESPGKHKGYEYSRGDNPTRNVLQTQLAALENGDHALVYSSGLASIDNVLNLLKSGDHVVAGDDLYGGTRRLFTRVAQNRGLTFSFTCLTDAEELERHMKPNTKLVWIESPTNPLLKVMDIRRAAEIAHKHGALLGVDNTFMSPYFQRPLELGADIVMHSMTKYMNGHSDVLMGCLVVKDQTPSWLGESLFAKLKFLQNSIGATPGPFDCFLVLRGLKTLAIRMDRHNANAMKVATFLESHPKVESVSYPGLPSHPNQALHASQSSGGGGMVTFVLKGGLPVAKKLLESLKLFAVAESLGGVESLIEHPAIMTHASVPVEVREELGISDGLIRISVGIEAADDLIADLDQALR
ncbi:MAG: PLP-dependent transferase [Armatimonadetes bacterium]|nr:PLP-dependent transferase [Armatimonadota bacterium]